MNFFINFSICLLITTNLWAKADLIGGVPVPENHMIQSSTVALVYEIAGKQTVGCSGTVIGPQIVISAAHCLAEYNGSVLFVGSGENPLKNKLFPISHVKYYSIGYKYEFVEQGDIAILILSSPLVGFMPAKIGAPKQIEQSTKLLQAGYGYNIDNDEDDVEFPFYGRLMMLTSGKLHKKNGRALWVKAKSGTSAAGGDSGGPLFEDALAPAIYGVTSRGEMDGDGNVFTVYAQPYFFQNWINCSLPKTIRLETSTILSSQVRCDKKPTLAVSELAKFNGKLCAKYRFEWALTDEYGCWPNTKVACNKHSKEIGFELTWIEPLKVCIIPD